MIYCQNIYKPPLLNYVIVQNNWNGYIDSTLNKIDGFSYSPLKIEKSFWLNYKELSNSRKTMYINGWLQRWAVLQKKELSPGRCSGVKNKSKVDCTVFATESIKRAKKSPLSIPCWQDKQCIVTLVFTCTKSKARVKLPESSSKIQLKISPAFCCSNMLKWGVPDLRSTCLKNLKNWKGSIAGLDDFKKDILFKEGIKRHCFWNSIETWPELHNGTKALKSCVNIAGVVLVQVATFFDRCVYYLTIWIGFWCLWSWIR